MLWWKVRFYIIYNSHLKKNHVNLPLWIDNKHVQAESFSIFVDILSLKFSVFNKHNQELIKIGISHNLKIIAGIQTEINAWIVTNFISIGNIFKINIVIIMKLYSISYCYKNYWLDFRNFCVHMNMKITFLLCMILFWDVIYLP